MGFFKDKKILLQISAIAVIVLAGVALIIMLALGNEGSSNVSSSLAQSIVSVALSDGSYAESSSDGSVDVSEEESKLKSEIASETGAVDLSAGGTSSMGVESTISEPEPTETIPVNADKEVGIWYSTWYAELAPSTPGYTTENRVPQYNTWISWSIQYAPLSPDGEFETYDTMNNDVLTYHISEMTEAGIDFIIMDQTNHIDVAQGYINARSLNMAKMIGEWNSDPSHRPLRYSTAIGEFQFTGDPASIEKEAKIIYERYNIQNFGGTDNLYYLEGKPLLVVYAGNVNTALWNVYKGSKEYADKFTIRWASNDSRPGFYGWAYNNGSVYDEEAVVVMPGWRNNVGAAPVLRDNGHWYEDSWDVVLSAPQKPKMVIINSFNEYAERTGVWPADTSSMQGTPTEVDMWFNADGQLDPYMYWNMTKLKIAEYKAD